jgi:NSS family neurotransmitter:Na+ symporter
MSGVRKGIEHWSKILMPALFVILIGLFCYSATLPGFKDAFTFVFYPNFSKLGASGVLNALGMAFFTLSVSLGIIVTYGSYMQREDNIPYNSVIIACMTVFVSLIAALITFPIVFSSNLPPEGGPGLVFQTLPILFSKLPAATLISTTFFLLLLFAALTSTMSLLEVLVANVIEVFDIDRKKATLLCTLVTFLVGIPSALSGSKLLFPEWELIYGKNFFDTMSYITASWFMPISGLLVTILVGWKMRRADALDEFTRGAKSAFFAKPWLFLIKWICPLIVLIIILQEAGLLKLIG